MSNWNHLWNVDGRRAAVLVGTLIAALALAGSAFAAAPTTSLIDGVLTSSGGSAAADGNYQVTFTIYDAKSGGAAVWSEGPTSIAVSGGRFIHALGSVTALDTSKLLAAKSQWLTLKVGADPELPAMQVHSTLFTLVAGEALKLSCDGCVGGDQLANGSISAGKLGVNYAGSATKGGPANDLACTACVGVAEMKFDGDVDLGGNALKAGDISGKTVTATTFIGDGSKLTGIKTPAGTCKVTGEVVKGIAADGTLICVAALDPAALPNDGLNEISNDLLSNQFVDTITGKEGVAIPDNTGADANSVLDFPDIGISQTFELTVDVANTDISNIGLTILPPDDKKTGWVLCDPCGEKDAKSYKKTFTKDALPKSGDLVKWINSNPKGTWNLKVLDTSFCVPQAPGNSVLCDINNKADGSIVTWSIKIQTLSNKKIAINGDTYQAGTANLKDVDVDGSVVIKGSLTVGGKPLQLYTVPTGAVYRSAKFHTHAHASTSWFMGNNASMFGGVNPSNWTDNNHRGTHMSSDKDVLQTLFNTKRYSGKNGNVCSEMHNMHSSTNGLVCAALFRIRNTTGSAINWVPHFYFTAYSGWAEQASVSLNGADNWSSGGVGNTSVTLSIPANRVSTVVFTATSASPYTYLSNHHERATVLGFYNNSLALPTGLQYEDDLDTAPNGWDK